MLQLTVLSHDTNPQSPVIPVRLSCWFHSKRSCLQAPRYS